MAGVVYSNFGDNFGYSSGTGLIFTNDGQTYASLAVGFVPVSSYSFDSIELVISDLIPNYGADVTVSLFADNGGAPGAALESFTVNGPLASFGSVAPVLTINSLLHPVLQAGSQYWVGLNGPAGGLAVWNQNSIGAPGFSASDGAGSWTPSTDYQGVLEVDGTLVPILALSSGSQGVIPEPPSTGLALCGLLAAGFAYKKQRAGDESRHRTSSV